MAYTSDTRTSGFGLTAAVSAMANLRDTVKARHAQNRVYRTTLAELEKLSVRDLADMGMTPYTIKHVAYEAAYGK